MRTPPLPVLALALVSFACHARSGGAEASGGSGTGDGSRNPASGIARAATSPADRIIELWYTGSLNGQLEGCDCPSGPVPGLVRTAAYIAGRDRARSILVDSGDVFGVKDDPAAYASIARIYAELGYDAVEAGDQDFIGGGRAFLEYRNNIPFRGSNVAVCPDADTCVALGMAPLVLERNGLTVALWSLADPRTYRFMPEPAKAAVKLTGERDAIARTMLAYPEPRDLDILVLHGGEDSARELAAAVPGFDAIIFGHDQVVLGAEKVGDTILASAGGDGALVGVMTLRLDGSGAVTLLESRARGFDRARDPQYAMAREEADGALAARGGAVNATAVFAAGLADGVNPCALSILALLVALLTRRRKSSMLAVGLGFVAGTFAAYFLAGLGLLSALAAVGLAVGSGTYALIARVIRLVTALACAILAVLSLVDAVRLFGGARGGVQGSVSPGAASLGDERADDSPRIILKLSEGAKRKAKDLVYAYAKASGEVRPAAAVVLAGGALVLGFSTSVFELACTGQVYLPTLAYMAGAGSKGALGYLFLYNVAFILPALGVFLASFLGLGSAALGEFMVQYLGYAKLGLALVFVALALFLILA